MSNDFDLKPSGTQSLDRALNILKLVAQNSGQGARLADLTKQAGLAQPTVHRLVQALQRQRFLAQDETSRLYHLGPEIFALGTTAASRYGLGHSVLPALTRLATATEDVACLTTRVGWHSICLHRVEGSFPIRSHALQAGDRHPLGVGAGSMAILAALADNEVEESLSENAAEFERRYPNYSKDYIRQEVADTRLRGYSTNLGRFVTGSWAVGVVVRDRRGECQGALSITAISSRLSDDRQSEIARALHKEADTLSKNL